MIEIHVLINHIQSMATSRYDAANKIVITIQTLIVEETWSKGENMKD